VTARGHVYLVRHGETAWSVSGRHTGRTDLALTAQGEVEARALAGQLDGVAFAHVLASPRERARRTCELAGLARPAEPDPDLAEWDYGAYEGMRTAEIRGTRPGWALFRDGCPDGESPEAAGARADRVIERLRTLEGNTALFSHGQFASVLAARWIGLPVVAAGHFSLGTASYGVLAYDPHHPDVPVIAMWNPGWRAR
jgi:probable phosphoglycerate mutase